MQIPHREASDRGMKIGHSVGVFHSFGRLESGDFFNFSSSSWALAKDPVNDGIPRYHSEWRSNIKDIKRHLCYQDKKKKKWSVSW